MSRETDRLWKIKNREKMLAQKKRHREKNREKLRAYARNRYASLSEEQKKLESDRQKRRWSEKQQAKHGTFVLHQPREHFSAVRVGDICVLRGVLHPTVVAGVFSTSDNTVRRFWKTKGEL